MNKRNKTLLFIIAALLISNVVLLFLYLGNKNQARDGHDRRAMMTEQLQKEVGFNKDQLARFEQMREQHMQKTRTLFDTMRLARENLFNQMGRYPAGDSALQPLLNQIARQQQQLDLQVYSNFRELRTICTPEQLPRFDSVAKKMMVRMGGGGRRKGPPGKPE
jgi:periplasmic protein CpxP/Spy